MLFASGSLTLERTLLCCHVVYARTLQYFSRQRQMQLMEAWLIVFCVLLILISILSKTSIKVSTFTLIFSNFFFDRDLRITIGADAKTSRCNSYFHCFNP